MPELWRKSQLKNHPTKFELESEVHWTHSSCSAYHRWFWAQWEHFPGMWGLLVNLKLYSKNPLHVPAKLPTVSGTPNATLAVEALAFERIEVEKYPEKRDSRWTRTTKACYSYNTPFSFPMKPVIIVEMQKRPIKISEKETSPLKNETK